MSKFVKMVTVIGLILLFLMVSFAFMSCSDSINGPKIIPENQRNKGKDDREQNKIVQYQDHHLEYSDEIQF